MMTHDDPKYWDVRTLERKLRQGALTRKDYDKYLKALPDRDDNVIAISAASVADDDDDDDDREDG
jgi:hypothetical protein